MAKPDPKRLDALVAMGGLLAPRAKLAAAVTQAFRSPAAYLAAHRSAMEERGIDEPIAKLPWIALIDALEAAKALFEIDWKAPDEDVEFAIRNLAKGFRLPPGDEERSTWEALEQAGIALRKKELQLAQLDYGADSYALVVVPRAKFPALVKLARQARYGAALAFGDELAAATKERQQRAKERARQLAAPPPAQPAWRWFAHDQKLWTIQVGPQWVSLGFEEPGVKRHVHHVFSEQAPCAAFAKQLLAGWTRGGFRELSKAEQDAWPRQGDGAYVGVVFPLPDVEGARYFRGEQTVRCFYVQGDAFVETSGTLGKNFGELENWQHGGDPAAALAARVAQSALWTPIDRAQVAALYARKSGKKPKR